MKTQEILYLQYKQETQFNRTDYSDQPYDFSWWSETSFEPLGLWTKPGDWYEEIAVDVPAESLIGKQVALVIVRYSTGDTFGSGTGSWCIAEVFTNPCREEIKALEDQIRDPKSKYNTQGYKPWTGYFERLESVETYYLVVQDGICPHSIYR